MRKLLLLVLLAPLATAGILAQIDPAHANDHPTLAIGATAPDFNLPGIDGRNYTLGSFRDARVLVIVFICNHCPTSQAYEDRLIRLTSDYAAKGVRVVAINPNHPSALRLDELGYSDLGDSFDEMKVRAGKAGYNFPYLYDGDKETASKQYGPISTPHIFIFDGDRKLRYNGRIDDMEDPKKTPRQLDARNAIDALLNHTEVPVTVTKVFGCSIKWAEKSNWREKAAVAWAKEPVSLDTIGVAGIAQLVRNNSNKLRLINVWATWCGPCVEEYPELVNLNRIYRDRGFELVSISMDDTAARSRALQFLQRQQCSSPNYIFAGDDKYKMIDAIDPKWQGALPYSMLVEPGGKIVYARQGIIDAEELRKIIFDDPYMGRIYKSTVAQSPDTLYPLDPLTAAEISKVVRILQADKATTEQDIFNIINLKEPPKREVLAYTPGTPFRREAFASFYDYAKNGVTEAVVDLNAGKVLSLKNISNVIGMGLGADSLMAENIVKKDPRWIAALKKRGLSIDSVMHRSIFPGDLGIAPLGHREQLVIPRRKGNKVDIEGLLAYTDFTTGRILKIVDEADRFSGKVDLNYFDKDSIVDTRKGPSPVLISQPEGSSIVITGHEIAWQNWRLRYGIDNREGLVIYNVRYEDNGKERPVMYKGSMPEMVVPYGAPSLLQAAYNFFDAGEYRLGQGIARSLSPGADAPENAAYMPATLHRESGAPYQLDRAVAIFEEYGGTLWRHGTVSRRATNLAIKYYTTIENYDYGFTWRFKQDGTIDVDIELTGIVEIQGVNRTNQMDLPDKNDLSYNGLSFGTLVHPHVEAINHQHFFVFRLDMDIDGDQHNSVMEMNAKLVPPGKMNPYSNAFVMEHTHFMTEKNAQRSVNYETGRSWHMVNSAKHNALGQHVGYMLMPGNQAKPFMPMGSVVRKKAGFLDHQLWITQYHEDEEYPAGKYPASNKIYDGLPQWTARNRKIDNNDIVLWYVAGITHIVRPEEWPVMPCHHMGFSLMPFGFFSGNPTMGIPNPSFLKDRFPDAQ